MLAANEAPSSVRSISASSTRLVSLCRNSREDHAVKRLGPTRARIATLRLGLDGACRVAGLDPPHGAGRGDAKSMRDIPSVAHPMDADLLPSLNGE